jgi:YesN/AraC family two-component response regulator
VNGGEIHALYVASQEAEQGCSVLISYTFLRELNPNIDYLWFEIGKNEEVNQKMEELILQMRDIYHQGGEWYNLKLRSIMYQIIYYLFTEYAQGKNEENVKELKTAELYKNIITYLNDHYQENIKMNQIAAYFGYNPDYFSKCFKNFIGENFKDYVTRLRLYKAKKQLILTDKSIVEIAVENGFTDSKAFIRDFKRDFGMTPLKYRKNIENEN